MKQETNVWSSSLQSLNRAYALKGRRCQVVEYNTDVLQTEEPTASRATRGVHDSVGVILGKSKTIFSLDFQPYFGVGDKVQTDNLG